MIKDRTHYRALEEPGKLFVSQVDNTAHFYSGGRNQPMDSFYLEVTRFQSGNLFHLDVGYQGVLLSNKRHTATYSSLHQAISIGVSFISFISNRGLVLSEKDIVYIDNEKP